MKKILFIIVLMASSHQLFAQDGFIGEIRMFAGNFPPKYWHYCDGTILPIAQNTALFSILGTTYGGNGQSTFALPDLRGRVPIHAAQGAGLRNYMLGETGGTESNTLNISQLPAHTHTITVTQQVSNADGTSDDPTGRYPALSKNAYSTTSNATGAAPTATAFATGSSQPVNNVQPFLGVNYIICLYGIYPSRQQ